MMFSEQLKRKTAQIIVLYPQRQNNSKSIFAILADEWFLAVGLATSAILFSGESQFAYYLKSPAGLALSLFWLFAVSFGCCLAVVRHADHLAYQLGEPFGTLILTLAVTIIEVTSISAMTTHGAHNPALVRDTIFSVIMIVLNGMVGSAVLLGGWRHQEQNFNLLGANTYLGVIIPLTVFSLILPNYTVTTAGPTLSMAQGMFVAIISLALYAVFLAVQTVRHRSYFRSGSADKVKNEDAEMPGRIKQHLLTHAAFIAVYMVLVVFLAERLATPVDTTLAALHAPVSLGGSLIAMLVAVPEALSAIQAAASNRLQRSMNILLGSALSTTALTIPVMIFLSQLHGTAIVLGLQSGNLVLLALTLVASVVTFSSGRTTILQGAIHLALFGAYIMLMFEG